MIDIANRQMVGVRGHQEIVVLAPFRRLTPDEARAHAAWLVVLAESLDPDGPPFAEVLEAVRGT